MTMPAWCVGLVQYGRLRPPSAAAARGRGAEWRDRQSRGRYDKMSGSCWTGLARVAAALVLLGTCAPRFAFAQEAATAGADADEADKITIVDRFRDTRAEWGRRFEDSEFGEYFNDHFVLALEYRFYGFLDGSPPQDSRRTRHEGRLELEYETELAEDVELFIDSRVWVDDDDYAVGAIEELEDDQPKRHILDVTEAYVDMYFDRIDLRVGKQIVKWGKADVFNPTDNINPDDYSTLTNDEPIGVVAAKMNYWADEWSAEFIYVPTFTPSRFPPRGTRFDLVPQMLPLPLLDLKERPDTIQDSQYGIRLKTTQQGWDFSLSWYDGVNAFPGVEVVPIGVPPFLGLEPVNHRLRVLGGDFATTSGNFGFHGEAGWFMSDGHREDDFLQYVLGIDYTWTDVFRDHDIFAIFEYAGEIVTAEATSSLPGADLQRAFDNTFAANIDYEVSEFLHYKLRWIYNFTGDDNFLVEPEVEYEVNDHLTVTAGFDVIAGGRETFFGRLRENDQFYLEARYTF